MVLDNVDLADVADVEGEVRLIAQELADRVAALVDRWNCGSKHVFLRHPVVHATS